MIINYLYALAGFFSNTTGQSKCISCPATTFSNTAATICSSCPFGTFSNSVNASQCNLCPLGTFGSVRGLSSCIRCSVGSFANLTGLSSCFTCPSGYSSLAGSSNFSSCFDLRPVLLVSVTPANFSTNRNLNIATISMIFNKPVQLSAAGSVTISANTQTGQLSVFSESGSSSRLTVSADGFVVTVTVPALTLVFANTSYIVRISGSPALIRDFSASPNGTNAYAGGFWTFTTEQGPFITPNTLVFEGGPNSQGSASIVLPSTSAGSVVFFNGGQFGTGTPTVTYGTVSAAVKQYSCSVLSSNSTFIRCSTAAGVGKGLFLEINGCQCGSSILLFP